MCQGQVACAIGQRNDPIVTDIVQIIHKGAHLCPVSETEEKGLWARKFQLYKQSKQGKTV